MLSNFIQKPIGIVTILGAAVGGPYAAFETEVGTQVRKAVMSRLAQNNTPTAEGNRNANSSDPFSLTAANNNYTNNSFGNVPSTAGWNGSFNAPVPTGMQPSSWSQPAPILPNSPSSPAIPTSSQMASMPGTGYPTNNGQVVSTVYGPATVQPIGPPMNSQGQAVASTSYPTQAAMFPNPTIETRSGPSTVIPGRTDQLWDYTLGVPALHQIQQQPNVAVGGGTVLDLREVLRFDIVPGWLPQRFARVSTVTSNVHMDGLRVPLITGTQANDIAGSLTYFFDANKALKRINLHGLTGDPSNLANLMVQYYQLKPEQSLGGQLFTTRWNNRVTSVMHVSPAPIIYAGADHSKYILFLELNQPDNTYGLSEEASEILRTAQATQRW